MGKKEKKPKKEKVKKEKKPEFPYAGSDRMKSFLTATLIVLSVLFVFLAFYTIRYCRYVGPLRRPTAASSAERSEQQLGGGSAAKTISYGTIWFSMPDGTIVQGET